MNQYFLAVILLAQLFFSKADDTGFASHPYHVSATEIEYNHIEKTLEISSKIFMDDFENVLSKLYKTKIDFTDVVNKMHTDSLVKKYITSHVAVRTNGRLMPLRLYGWEADKEVVYVYTVAAATQFDRTDIMVENTILYDLFIDQMNIVHFIIGKERKSFKLNFPERKWQFGF